MRLVMTNKLTESNRLDDFENSCAAYDKAVELGGSDYLVHLNYAITLISNDEVERARENFEKFETIFGNAKSAADDNSSSLLDIDEDVKAQAELVRRALRGQL